MKTTKNKSPHFLRSKFFIIILCGLFINISIANIGNVKAQDSVDGTPIAEEKSPASEKAIVLINGTVVSEPEIDNAVISALKTTNAVLPGAQIYAITDITQLSDWRFISTLGLANVGIDLSWNLEDNGLWAGIVLLEHDGNSWVGSVEGSEEFSQMLSRIPDGVLSQNAKIDLDPLKRALLAPAIYHFPWTSGTLMQYGSEGVHDNGFATVVSGWKAVDFLSGYGIAGEAPNVLRAATTGTVTYKCTPTNGGVATAIKVNDLFYTHLNNSSSIYVGKTYAVGESIGSLKTGNFNENCGYAVQSTNTFHVHLGFPNTGSVTFDGWTLNMSNGLWTKGSTSKGKLSWFQSELDSTPPATSIAFSGTVGENNWYRSAVQVTLSATDNSGGSGVSQTKYQIDSNTGTWLTYTAPFSVSTNGTHTVYYKSMDAAENWETEKSTTFKIDSTSPTGSFTIQNGSAQTYSTVVDLNTQANDPTSGVAAVHFRDAGQVTWSSWFIPGSTPWQLVGFNGQTTSVEAQFKDNAGNVSAVYSDNIKINLYPTRPSSSLYTLQRSTFGASGMNINSPQYVLRGTAGQTTVIGRMESSNYKMNSGYWAMNEAPPTLIYPSVASITRMSSDSTNATSVDFTATFSKPVTGVDVGDFSLMTSGVLGAAVNGFSGSGSIYTVSVSTGSGSGTIGLNVVDNNTIQDLAGNPLGGPGLVNGDFTTGEVYTIDKTAPAVGIFTVPSPSMSVDIPIAAFTASDNIGVSGYLITNSATTPASGANGWTSVEPVDYTVVSDGSYTLYPWVKDAAGNISPVFSSPRAVLVDTTKPTSIMTPLPSFVGSTMVPLSWSGSDTLSGIAAYDLQARAEFDAQWTNVLSNTAQTNYTFDGIEGTTYYFRVRARDIAGNVEEWREPYDTSTVGTDYGLTINNGALFTNSAEVVLTIAGKPETIQMQIDNDGGFSGVLWEPYTSHKTWQIIQYGNYVLPRIVYLRYKDIDGNVSATYQDDIILDVTPPTGSVSIASQSNGLQTMDSTVTLLLSATDDVSGVDQMLISNQADFTGATWENYAVSRVWTIENNTVIYVKFRDNAGNVSLIYSTNKPATFTDVPVAYWSWQYIERLYNAGITGGCSAIPMNYCPTIPVTRAQMAIFLLRGIHGSAYTPPPATGTKFTDVPLGTFGAAWIEQLATEGITSGCGGGNYCPNTTVSRAQMAIFLVRAKHGVAFVPPTATGIFPDVPVGSFGANYIEQLVADAITSGCGGGNYCPNTIVKRDSMAVFLVKTFGLP